MLAALHLKSSWMYRKIQVLAIFDDLDTILLMIPLQIAMIGLQWQMFVVVAIVTLLLVAGWRKLGHYDLRQDWKSILLYAVVVFALTQGLYAPPLRCSAPSTGGIHIEVLLPAFVLGMTMRHRRHIDGPPNARQTRPALFLPRPQTERATGLSMGMFTRGEVGAGVIFIALG